MNRIIPLILLLFFGASSVFALPYNFSSTESIPIKLNVIEEISTKKPIYEGQTIQLKVAEDVYWENQLIVRKYDIINAKIETIITSGMNGFPAEIIIDDFEIPNIEKSKTISTYSKKGQNRCLWVFPLKWALTWIPFVGSLTNFIRGGHAKIKTTDIITVNYYPNWR